MISSAKSASFGSTLHKTVQGSPQVPISALPITTIKALEIKLTAGSSPAPIQLWFLAETERNVYLWRRGLSVIDEDRFDFWVDIPLLIDKRLSQFELGSDENPFFGNILGEPLYDHSKVEEEEYLLSLAEKFAKVARHAHALQMAARIESGEVRPLVVIPR